MLREFVGQSRVGVGGAAPAPRLAQADGLRLPFADATFDAVMLIQVVGAARSWRGLLAEARRVLRSGGALVEGRTAMPEGGLDAQMKRRLASLLEDMGVAAYHKKAERDIPHSLASAARSDTRVVAAAWTAQRTPRGFLERQPTGARF